MAKFHPLFQKIALPCVSAAFHIYCGYRVTGRENVPEGGCVICPNHSDVIDPADGSRCNRQQISYPCHGKKGIIRRAAFSID